MAVVESIKLRAGVAARAVCVREAELVGGDFLGDEAVGEAVPLELSRVHWVRPELVAEVAFQTWTADKVMRHVSYQGLREDKRASDVVRKRPD